MNPKPNAAKEKRIQRRKQRTPAKKFTFTVIKIIIIIFVAVSCAAVGIIGGAVYGYIKTATPITPEMLKPNGLTTYVYDSKGKLIVPLKGDKNREEVSYDKVPQYMKDAIVAIEDKRFFEHNGVDIRRTLGAVLSLFKYGGSTITQQLIKNVTGESQVSLKRKVQEQYRAIMLEKKMEKWQILEAYMNWVDFGNNCFGVQTAAKNYFNKDISQLDLAECASLAGIPNGTSTYNPFTTKGRERNIARQKIILGEMLKQNKITQAQYDQAINEKLVFADSNKPAATYTGNQSYFVDQVVNDVVKDLAAQGVDSKIARRNVYNSGYKIYTTMDSDVQKAMDEVYQDDKYFPVANKKLPHAQSAMVIIDPRTGQVRALYGGYGKKQGDLILNRATQIERQPGSSFKPIAVYGPALDLGLITAGTVIDDVPVYMNGINNPRYPENDDHKYKGLTTIRTAITNSVNVVAAKVYANILTPDQSHKYLNKVGINRDDESNVSVALGGLHQGVSPMLMAAAYVPFDNNGVYIQPTTYTKVLDMDGNVILEKKSKSTIVYDEKTAYIMTSMMQDVPRKGTAAGYVKIQNGNVAVAGKTGTTSSNYDKWFVGFTPYYVGATWYGYDKLTAIPSAERPQALKIWNAVMNKVHAKLSARQFEEPQGLIKKTICTYSGKVPTAICYGDPRGNSIFKDEVFLPGTEPNDDDFCDVHVKVKVDKSSKDAFGRNLLAGPYCPLTSIADKTLIKRKIPFKPVKYGDPYPLDWVYEYPEGEYCNIHGPR